MFITAVAEAVLSMDLNESTDKVTPSMFLSRLLGLAVQRQSLLFAYFSEVMERLVAEAKQEGRFNEGVVDIVGQNIELISDKKQLTPQIAQYQLAVDRGVSFDMALQRVKEAYNIETMSRPAQSLGEANALNTTPGADDPIPMADSDHVRTSQVSQDVLADQSCNSPETADDEMADFIDDSHESESADGGAQLPEIGFYVSRFFGRIPV